MLPCVVWSERVGKAPALSTESPPAAPPTYCAPPASQPLLEPPPAPHTTALPALPQPPLQAGSPRVPILSFAPAHHGLHPPAQLGQALECLSEPANPL